MDFVGHECSSSITTAKERNEEKRNSLPLTHLLVELTSLEELSFPTSSSTRIKFTCLDASAHYLAVGSTSGTVYLFSRFASKYRSRVNSVPIQVISIKDGPIVKLSISPNEKYLAAASKRGSLTISVLFGIDQNPITLFSTDSHVGTDVYDQPIHITELRWCSDNSILYAGDTKGRISRTLVHNRNFFRSPTDIIFETDSEIVQLDLRDDYLLASTLTRCCICDLKTYSCIQVGKRLRKGHFGAVFYSDQQNQKLKYTEKNCSALVNASGCNDLTMIFASRPNGRLWEANGHGVVYSTHQYRNLSNVCQFPVVSFKDDNLFDRITSVNEVQNINFGLLTLIKCQNLFLMTKTDTTFYLIDPMDSHMVLMSTVDSVGRLRKLTLFTVEKAVEKLHWKQCYSQAAQLIYVNYVMNENYNSVTKWNCEQLEDILSKITFHRLHVTHTVLDALHKLLGELKRNGGIKEKSKATVHRLNSGIHQVMQNSGYEDDFVFRAPSPLRLRSKSTAHIKPKNDWKRRSLPLSQRSVVRAGDEVRSDDSEVHRKKLMNEALIMLLDAEKTSANDDSIASLRTLLDSSDSIILFNQQVTIDDITKDLVIAKNFQQLLGDHNYGQNKQLTAQVDFETLFGRRDPLEVLEKCVENTSSSVNVDVAHLRTIRRNRQGARIVKGIKPFGKRSAIPEIECGKLEHCKWTSNQQLIKRDLISKGISNGSNGTVKDNEGSENNSTDQLLDDDTGLLNKSYIIEKNFVPTQPIETIWTINGDDEENDSSGMKSSKATATLNCEDERLINSDEVTIESKSLSLAYCQACGLHRLWHHVMIFGPKMSQLRVIVDQFAAGGVPVTMDQWTKLFEYRAAAIATAKNRENSAGNLCGACAEFFEFDDHLKQKASLLREVVERAEKRAAGKKSGEDFVRMEAMSWDEDLVYRVFFKNTTLITKTLSELPEIQKKVEANSQYEVRVEDLEFEECLKKFLWLPSVKISQLLLCMRYCEGLSAVFDFLNNDKKLTSCLTTEDWQWLTIIKAYECDRFCDLMPKEVINGLLAELKISTIEDVGIVSATSDLDVFSDASGSKTLNGNLIISVDGNCTFCTLPLKTRVTDTDGYITVFRCGHLYHQICLREANVSRCLRCDLERRCHRQKKQQMSSGDELANSSHPLFVKNSRHLAKKVTRASVTSLPNVKVPERT